jgi:hypothetical protein
MFNTDETLGNDSYETCSISLNVIDRNLQFVII